MIGHGSASDVKGIPADPEEHGEENETHRDVGEKRAPLLDGYRRLLGDEAA